jgi:hypothetical protein
MGLPGGERYESAGSKPSLGNMPTPVTTPSRVIRRDSVNNDSFSERSVRLSSARCPRYRTAGRATREAPTRTTWAR